MTTPHNSAPDGTTASGRHFTPTGSFAAQTDRRRVVFATVVGTTVEWYDFFIYANAAGLVAATTGDDAQLRAQQPGRHASSPRTRGGNTTGTRGRPCTRNPYVSR